MPSRLQRGADGQARVQEMSDALKAQVLAGQVTDNFKTVGVAETLRRHGRVDAAGGAEVREALFALAAQASSVSTTSRGAPCSCWSSLSH